ncbi:MAG: hypothetical protein KY443_07160 [Actinobacteria bacterium]|nr:hypothetical protein [Actinomycetota bacterium]
MNEACVPVTCRDFDAAVDELAVDGVAEPRRSELLTHAATCARCEAQLDELAAVADRLLLLAPAVEPPPGFESRALARMEAADGGTDSRDGPRRFRLRVLLAAAAVVVALGAGVVLGRNGPPPVVVRSGIIVSASGVPVGTVELDPSPRPHVLITVDRPARSGGTRLCELVLPDGTSVVVGSWGYRDVAGGSWATGIDEALLQATAMRIVADDGRVVATAHITASRR